MNNIKYLALLFYGVLSSVVFSQDTNSSNASSTIKTLYVNEIQNGSTKLVAEKGKKIRIKYLVDSSVI